MLHMASSESTSCCKRLKNCFTGVTNKLLRNFPHSLGLFLFHRVQTGKVYTAILSLSRLLCSNLQTLQQVADGEKRFRQKKNLGNKVNKFTVKRRGISTV